MAESMITGVDIRRTMLPFCVTVLLVCAVVSVQGIEYRISEQNPEGEILGNVATDAGLVAKYNNNGEILAMLEYRLSSQEYSDYFEIDLKSSVLSAKKIIDRDAADLCENAEICEILLDIRVQPGQYFEIIKVKVTIEDANDNTPSFPENQLDLILSEASKIGTILNLQTATDPDSPSNSIQSYEVSPLPSAFSLKTGSNGVPQLELIEELDRESVPSYSFVLIATDGGSPAKTGSVSINLQVKDINDNNPSFDNQTYVTTIIENVPKYTTILKVHAQDLDEGVNGEIQYYFEEKTLEMYGDLFGIDAVTGEIYVKDIIIDYEDNPVFYLEVAARDGSEDSLPALAQVTVFIRDINDHAPQITINDAVSEGVVQVREAGAVGDFVAHISVVDLDGGDNGKFNCSLENSDQFSLLQLFENDFKIVTTMVFDREIQSEYELILICQDKGSISQSETQFIKVQIQDVNDHQPKFSQEYYEKTIEENNAAGTFIVQVNATDEDIGANARIKYSLESRVTDKFHVDEESGIVTAKQALDHEDPSMDSSTQTFLVYAQDEGDPSLSSSTSIVVHITDLDDNAPKFTQFSYNLKVNENMPRLTVVDQINATDPDDYPNNKFTFEFDPSYASDDAFAIDADTGHIYTNKILDREVQPMYHLVVVATSIVGQLTNRNNVFIFVLDQNDSPPDVDFPTPFNNTIYINPDLPLGFVVARILARDNDTGDNALLSYNITSGNEGRFFTIDQATGAVILKRSLKEMEEYVFLLSVTVYDGGIPVKFTGVSLNIVVNKSSDVGDDLISKQNVAIVISIATVSGILMVVLLIAIVFIIQKQKKSERSKKYNYVPRIADQKMVIVHSNQNLNGALPQSKGMPPGGVIRIEGRSQAKPAKRQTSNISKNSTNKDLVGNLNESFDKSMEKPDLQMEYPASERSDGSNSVFSDEPSGGPPLYSGNSLYATPQRSSSRPPANTTRQTYPVPVKPPEVPQKLWNIPPQSQPEQRAETQAEGEKDSDSNCSADMSNTDSGRGSNDENNDNFRTQSPQGACQMPSPPTSPSKPPQPGLATQALPVGIHRAAPQGSSYREPRPKESTPSPDVPANRDNPALRDFAPPRDYSPLGAYGMPRRTPSQQSKSSQHSNRTDSRGINGTNYDPYSGQGQNIDLQERNWVPRSNVPDAGYHGNQRQMHPTWGREEWNARGDSGGYYFASHV